MAERIGITPKGIEKQLANLKAAGSSGGKVPTRGEDGWSSEIRAGAATGSLLPHLKKDCKVYLRLVSHLYLGNVGVITAIVPIRERNSF